MIKKIGFKIIRKFFRIVFFILSLPITCTLVLLFPFYKIKFISLFSDRIGHYSMNTELLLCYLDEIRSTEKRVKYFFYMREAPICNEQLHLMWKRIIPIVPFTKMAAQIDRLMIFILKNKYKNVTLKKFEVSVGNVDYIGSLRKHPMHLLFTNPEISKGEKVLLDLGIPVGAKFICLLVRDPAYLNAHFSSMNWSHHFYRDCDIDHCKQAALYLANKGYYVIRMGKTVSKRFDTGHPRVIDYANHSLRSDFADIYLTSRCVFFISTGSGLDGVAQVFRRPFLQVNIAPFKHQLQYWYPCELFIIKKVFDKKNQRYVSIKEVDDTIANASDLQAMFDRLDWIVVENSENEILEAVSEMEKLIEGKNDLRENNTFHPLLKTQLTLSVIDNRDLLRSNPEKFYTKMVAQFWNENQTLLLE